MTFYNTDTLIGNFNIDCLSEFESSVIRKNISNSFDVFVCNFFSDIIIEEKKNDSKSIENRINENRLSQLERNFTDKFISYILEDDFEYGVEYKAHLLTKEQMKINAAVTKDWLNRIYVDNFYKSDILVGILRVISRFTREEIFPIGETIALASLSHKEEIVQENAIRAFESWGGQGSVKILENVVVTTQWIKEYLDGVIEDLKLDYAN
jgi:hypothetical protein